MKTKQEIIAEHYNCTCDEIYKSRSMVDPNCILCREGGEFELMMDEWAKQQAIAFAIDFNKGVDDRMDVRYREFMKQWERIFFITKTTI